ncbi:OmpH family outer membrane protein [Marivirga sp. S37H4]|uniref:OmpH family outer membrane protein n=1 Tax=Marivirga aurantiaca TaxID=2802615 RepID=A0A935CA21_9BACT|nr:OmpH family outer membrane protein [Marivirga aurantiaca]MBK6266289.1 OmpH family outer membrane protein [Marivirga aurantiaca]
MKNLSIILNVILLIAVGYLYIAHFSKNVEIKPAEAGDENKEMFQNVSIAYIDSDSLLTKYELTKEIEEKLATKQEKFEKEYQNKAQGLQQEISDFQRTAANLTVAQGKALEESLMKKQQNLMRYQESLTQQLRQEEAKLNEELYNNVSEYLKEYGKKNNLELVLTYSRGSGVLYANEQLDISNDVIKGLNEAYLSEKEEKTAE